MADTIDKLQIEVGSSSSSASKELDALSKSLLGLNKSLGVFNSGKFSSNAEKIAAGYKGIASAVKAVDANKINSISDGLSSMTGASGLSESAKQMKVLGDVTRSAKKDVDNLASSTRKLNFWEDPVKMANLEKYGATDPEGNRRAFEKAYGRQPGETYTTPNTRVGGDWHRTAKAIDEATESVKRFNDESRKSETAPAVSAGLTNFLSGIKDKASSVNSLSDSFSRLWRSISQPLAEKAGLGNLQEMTAELKHYQRLMKDMENGFTVVGKGRGRREEPVDFDTKEYGLASKRADWSTNR